MNEIRTEVKLQYGYRTGVCMTGSL